MSYVDMNGIILMGLWQTVLLATPRNPVPEPTPQVALSRCRMDNWGAATATAGLRKTYDRVGSAPAPPPPGIRFVLVAKR